MPSKLFPTFLECCGRIRNTICKRSVRRGTISEEMNKVAIFLLPKIEETKSLSKFRPIALCNVLIKIISKVLASRLQSVMHKLTEKFQSSFISGRLTTNNIITAQESIHILQQRKGGKAEMILKLDLENAYDRVS